MLWAAFAVAVLVVLAGAADELMARREARDQEPVPEEARHRVEVHLVGSRDSSQDRGLPVHRIGEP